MTDMVFVDTNVLVYSRDASEPQKQEQAMAWMAHLWGTRQGRLSFQVLQEFYVTVTHKLKPGLDPESARNDVRSLLAWHPLSVDARIFFLGMFIDWIGILLITIPIFSPILLGLGFDPLWVGLVVCISLQISFLTPPFAYSIFYLKGIAPQIELMDMYKGIIPFVFIQAGVTILCIAFPPLCLWVPQVLGQ